MLLGFKKQFVPYILEGSKTHTIRGERKYPPRVGEICHCYTNMRQKDMKLLGRWPCVRVESITISASVYDGRLIVCIEGRQLANDEANAFFFRDGFRTPTTHVFGHMAEARSFWEGSLPFSGKIIHWNRQL